MVELDEEDCKLHYPPPLLAHCRDSDALVATLTTVFNTDQELCQALQQVVYYGDDEYVFKACAASIISNNGDRHSLGGMRRDLEQSIHETRPYRRANWITWYFYLYAFEYITGRFRPDILSSQCLVAYAD